MSWKPAAAPRRSTFCHARRAAARALAAVLALAPLVAAPAEPPTALAVTPVTARRAVWPVEIEATGAVVACQEAVIGAQVAGAALTEVRANVGDRVRRGQVLARFDAAALRIELEQAEAAEAQAVAQAAQAAENEQRALLLRESGALSAQDILQSTTTAATARAQVRSARAQSAARRLALRHATVVAPDDGLVSARLAAVGSFAQAGQELFRLIVGGRLEWRGELTAEQLLQVRPGQPAVLRLPDRREARARVRTTAPALDPASRLGLVYADLDAASPALAGMVAAGRIALAEREAVVVPARSLVVRDGRSWVMKLRAEGPATASVVQQPVETGRRQGDEVEITAGLAPGDAVAVQGAGFLHPGDRVRVVPSP